MRRKTINLPDNGKLTERSLSRREFLAMAARGAVLGAVPGALALAGCGRRNAQSNRIVIALDREVTTLDPAMHRSRTVESVVRNIFDGLVTRDRDMKIVPELAESWRLIDENNWEFKLRGGVKFQDGSPFTAEDVIFTIERILKPGAIGGESSPRKGLLGEIDGVKAVDDLTVVVHTAEPFPALPAMLTFHEIVPKRYIEKVGEEEFASNPIGTGPFRLASWKRGERIQLVRFDDYYGGSPEIEPVGPAKLDVLVFKAMPESSTRIASLLAGEATLIEKVPPHSVKILSTPQTEARTAEGTRTHYLGFNLVRGPFRDLRARQAIAHAIDFESIVNKVLSGYATVLAGPLVPIAFGFDKDLRPVEHSPNRARRLMRQCRFPMDLLLEIDTEEADKEIAQVLADQLRAIGLNARARVWNWDMLNPALLSRRRTMFLTHWGNASLDPIGILEPLFTTGGRGNFTGFADATVDSLLSKARSSLDERERERLYIRAQRAILAQLPAAFGLARKEIYGVSKRVTNWQPSSDGMLNMHDVSLRP